MCYFYVMCCVVLCCAVHMEWSQWPIDFWCRNHLKIKPIPLAGRRNDEENAFYCEFFSNWNNHILGCVGLKLYVAIAFCRQIHSNFNHVNGFAVNSCFVIKLSLFIGPGRMYWKDILTLATMILNSITKRSGLRQSQCYQWNRRDTRSGKIALHFTSN